MRYTFAHARYQTHSTKKRMVRALRVNRRSAVWFTL